jgi:hypothetical protein
MAKNCGSAVHLALSKNKSSRIACIAVCISLVPLFPLTLEGRLPGEHFREDNPPRFGAVMSFVSQSDSVVVLHTKAEKPEFTIAKQLARIAQGFKIKPGALEKVGLVEGNLRWLEYTFRKKSGGGILYITRQQNRFIYLVIFNLQYEVLNRDLPYINRYIKQLQLKETNDE